MLKYCCAAASKCSCTFTLEVRHAPGSEVVSVWQTAEHAFHDIDSAAHLAQLRLHPSMEAIAITMLEAGAKPIVI
jgi:hypothetical protein